MHLSPCLPENLENIVAEYKRLWPTLLNIHTKIGTFVSQESVKACAKRLGMIGKHNGKKTLAFLNEKEADLFQDYLLYMHRPRGISFIRQMFNRKLYPQGSDEQQLLEAMAQARFSVFLIKELIPSAGFIALDIVRGEEFFILNQSIDENREPVGLLLGLRIFPFQNLWMHTGADLVIGKVDNLAPLQPMEKVLNEKEERDLNELNIFKWREMAKALH